MKVFQMLIPLMLSGFKVTLLVFVLTTVLSLPLSVPIAALRLSKNPILSKITAAYIYFMRSTPLMLQLMFIYFGLPLIPVIGITLDRMVAVMVAFVLNYAAYFAEIFRGGIISIPPGQWEAGKVLGLPKIFVFTKIILPQVIRNTIPSISNEIITLIKDTSLVYVLGATEILKAAKIVANTYATFTPYIVVGIVYMILTAILSKVLTVIEKKYDYRRR